MYPDRKPSGCKAAIWFHPGVHEQTKQSRSDGSAKQRAFLNEKRLCREVHLRKRSLPLL